MTGQSLVAQCNRLAEFGPELERPLARRERHRPFGAGRFEGQPDDELVGPLRFDDRTQRGRVGVDGPAPADGHERPRGGAIVVGDRDTAPSLAEIDASNRVTVRRIRTEAARRPDRMERPSRADGPSGGP